MKVHFSFVDSLGDVKQYYHEIQILINKLVKPVKRFALLYRIPG